MTTVAAQNVNVLDQIEALRKTAQSQGEEYQTLLQQATTKLAERNATLLQISEVASSAVDSNVVPVVGPALAKAPAPAPALAKAPAPVAKRGRPPGSGKKAAAAAKAAPKGAHKVAPSERNYTNEISLKRAIWNVLSADPKTFKKHLENYPFDTAYGMKVSELKEIIEKEQIWTSSSENIAPQIQTQIYALRNEGKVARNDEDRRYYIVEGATFEG